VPVNNVKELIALARANPGRLNYASARRRQLPAIFPARCFVQPGGIDVVHIP